MVAIDRADQPATVTRAAPESAAGPGLGLGHGIAVLLMGLGFAIGARTLHDNSFLTHLATGRHILDTGGVPTGDVYSATAPGTPWVVQSWLASVIYAALERTVGFAGIRVLHGALVAVSVGVLWWLTDGVRSIIRRVPLAGAVVVVGAPMWQGRPLLFGLLGFVIALAVVRGRIDPRWLVPTIWLWAQTHGSFPLAGVLATMTLLGAWLDRRNPSNDDVAVDARGLPVAELRVMLWTIVGTAAAVVGPLGFRLLWFPVELLGNRDALEGVSEWAAPSFDHPSDLLFGALVVTLLVVARGGAPWRLLLPAIVVAISGFLAIRNLALASAVLAVVIAELHRHRDAGSTGSEFSGLTAGDGGPVARMLLVVGSLVAVIAVATVPLLPSLTLDGYAVDELDLLDEWGLLDDPSVAIVHRGITGNYWTFRDGADARVFVDDRFDMYPLDVLQDHRHLVVGGDVGEILTRRNADVVIWRPETAVSSWLDASASWTIVEADEDWLIACRTTVLERCTAA